MTTPTQPPANALAPKADRRLTLRKLFDQQKPELAKLLPRGMDAERLFRIALTECVKNPELLKCTAESWALAMQTCAAQGLYPDSGLGFMYLVPRKNRKAGIVEVKPLRGYQGDMKLARNSGEVADIYAEVVYTKDHYKVTKGLTRNIEHVPYDGDDDPGPLRACYAVAKLRSGEICFVTLNKRDVQRHMASSDSAGEDWSPWKKHTDAMWKKTAIHELTKWLPKETEAAERAFGAVLAEGRAPIDTTAIDLGRVEVPLAGEPAGKLDQVADQLGGQEEDDREACAHPDLTPERLAQVERGRTIVCTACGEELEGQGPAARVPGEDDSSPIPSTAATVAPTPEPEPDPNTPEGNPFLRAQQRVAAAKGQRRLEEK